MHPTLNLISLAAEAFFVLLNLLGIQTRRVRHDVAMSSKWSGE